MLQKMALLHIIFSTMPISLTESAAVNDIADLLYDFLPGKPHPYADQTISFPGVAAKLGLGKFWASGSKKPSITQLLQQTLEFERSKFCDLIIQMVRTGMTYRSNKNKPITREEIVMLNDLVTRVDFKIPELSEPTFLDTLPRKDVQPLAETTMKGPGKEVLVALQKKLVTLNDMEPQPRGYAFEKFLNELFDEYDLKPKSPFRLVGEQIDGSFQFSSETYLLEARWQNEPVGVSDLLVFDGKVKGKAKWSRGLFVSYNGFSKDGLKAFRSGRSTNIIGFSAQDLYFVVEGKASLTEAIEIKARNAAETGKMFVSLFDLLLQG